MKFCRNVDPKIDHLTKLDINIYRSQLVYYCTYFYEMWQVYYVRGPTCTYAKILNKNKTQDVGGRHLGFLHKQ